MNGREEEGLCSARGRVRSTFKSINALRYETKSEKRLTINDATLGRTKWREKSEGIVCSWDVVRARVV